MANRVTDMERKRDRDDVWSATTASSKKIRVSRSGSPRMNSSWSFTGLISKKCAA